MSWEIRQGDCIEQMTQLEECSVDAVVCDPPYGLSKEPDIAEVLRHWLVGDDYEHRGGGFMGQSWDSFVPGPAYWRAAFRVLKPGGYLLAFAGDRTFDLMGISIRFAGFQIRKSIMWLYGSGFPKSKNLDGDWEGWGTDLKPAHETIVVARKPLVGTVAQNCLEHGTGALNINACRIGTTDDLNGGTYLGDHRRSPDYTSTDSAPGAVPMSRLDNGIGEFEQPAGRWPANVILSHTPLCELVGEKKVRAAVAGANGSTRSGGIMGESSPREQEIRDYADEDGTETVEAWDCAPGCPVAALDAQSGELKGGRLEPHHASLGKSKNKVTFGKYAGRAPTGDFGGDSGGASRFFYCAKTSRAERNAGLEGFEGKGGPVARGAVRTRECNVCGSRTKKRGRPWPICGHKDWIWVETRDSHKGAAANNHPTVKPINLMRWLVRLVTPPSGLILDPFLGSGTTGCAAVLEGFDFLGIEREEEYVGIAEARIAFWAQHVGREIEEVLGLNRVSTAARKQLEEMGQGQLDLEAAA